MNLRQKFQSLFGNKQDRFTAIPGVLGDGSSLVEVEDRLNFVYARIDGQVTQVYNVRVSPIPDLEVWIGFDPSTPEVLQVLSAKTGYTSGIDQEQTKSILPHGETHSWGEGDPVAVWQQQIIPGKVAAYMNHQVVVYPILVWATSLDEFVLVQSELPIDLGIRVPSTVGKARYVLSTIDTSGRLVWTPGDEVDIDSLTYADIPIPPTGTLHVLAAIRLFFGQEAILEAVSGTDIVDLRGSSLDGDLTGDARYLKLDASNGPITGTITSTVASGSPPFSIVSTTVVPNLNVDMIDGLHGVDLLRDCLTEKGDLLYRGTPTNSSSGYGGVSIMLINAGEAEKIVPDSTVTIPSVDVSRPVTIDVSLWVSSNTGPYDGNWDIRLRRSNVGGSELYLTREYFGPYLYDDSGHARHITFSYVDNTPDDGVYVLTVARFNGFFGTTDLYSNEYGVTAAGYSTESSNQRLPIGTAGQVLTVSGGEPAWMDKGFSGSNSGDVTLGDGSDPALSLSGQVLTLANVLTPTEHTAIGDGSPHHAAVTLAANHGLSLAGQQLALGTPGTVTGSSTNAVTTTTHTHALDNDLVSLTKYLLLTGGNLTGPLGIGAAADANTNLYSSLTPTITAGIAYAGRYLLTASPAAASSGTFYGLSFGVRTSNNNANAFSGSLRGVEGTAYHNGNATLANLTGIEAQVGVSLAGALGTTTNARGIRLTALNVAAGATITNFYGLDIGIDTATATTWNGINIAAATAASQFKFGLQIGNISGGTGGNYAIYTNTGLVRLGDQLTVTGSADRIQLQVTANGTQTTDLARFGGASSYLAIEADGTLRLVGNATGWKDIFFPQSPPKATGAGNPTLGTIIGNLRGYSYAVNDVHDFDPQEYGHDGKTSASITYHIHWYSMTNVAAARYVKWELEETWCNPSATINATTTTAVEVVIPANTPVGYQFVTDVLVKAPSGIGPATLLHCRIRRVAASGTAPAADPFCGGVHAHYEVDTPAGSRTISGK